MSMELKQKEKERRGEVKRREKRREEERRGEETRREKKRNLEMKGSKASLTYKKTGKETRTATPMGYIKQ